MYIVFDIGGTHIRIGVSLTGEKIEEQLVVPTPPDFDQGVATIKDAAIKLTKGKSIAGSSGAIAGVLAGSRQKLFTSPNLLGWVGRSLSDALQAEWGVPVSLNDAALAGLAEATIGAGIGSPIVAYVTVSTGIGGARIVQGKIDATTYGFEPGQHIIDIDHSACPTCRQPGTLEHYASGSGLRYRFKQEPSMITDTAVWQEATHWLAVGLHNLTMFWSPSVIVLGGALILKQRIALSELQVEFEKVSKIFPILPALKMAELGSDNGLLGALAYIQTKR